MITVHILDEKTGWLFERERMPRKRFIYKEAELQKQKLAEIKRLEEMYRGKTR